MVRVRALAEVILGEVNKCNTRTSASSYLYDNVISYHAYMKEQLLFILRPTGDEVTPSWPGRSCSKGG